MRFSDVVSYFPAVYWAIITSRSQPRPARKIEKVSVLMAYNAYSLGILASGIL
jgi:hypothetical protein